MTGLLIVALILACGLLGTLAELDTQMRRARRLERELEYERYRADAWYRRVMQVLEEMHTRALTSSHEPT